MRRATRGTTIIPAAILAALVAGASACSDRVGSGWDWERMRVQPRYAPYGASAFYPDGKAMQAPPAGAVPREAVARAETDSADTTLLAATLLAAMPAAQLDRGATRFHIFCAVCHGERGNGVSVVASNMDDPKPPSLLAASIRALSAARLYAVISDGFGQMPSYASELSAADRWAVIAYVRALQRSQPVTPFTPADSAAAAAR